MLVKISHRRWNLRFVNSRFKKGGDCDPPFVPNKQIRINSALQGERRLDVLIHEMMHAAVWDLSEETVETLSSDIARVLWRLGYRDDMDVARASKECSSD